MACSLSVEVVDVAAQDEDGVEAPLGGEGGGAGAEKPRGSTEGGEVADGAEAAGVPPGGAESAARKGAAADEAVVDIAEEDAGDQLPGCRLMSLLCLVGGLEGADGVLLPCVFYALQLDLGLSLNHLALMSLVQGLAGNVAAPFWGTLADRGLARRKTLIVVGCVVQGLITLALAAVDQLWLMLVLRGLNGMMLASLRPIANGIVADVTSESRRGQVFGFMGFAMNFGTMAGSLIGTNLATRRVAGLQGWRVAFLIIGAASVAVGALAGLAMAEPRNSALERRSAVSARGGGAGALAAEECRRLTGYFRIPTFRVLILQGVFGVVPWNALGYKNLFFQVAGLSAFETSVIDILSQIAGSVGGVLGGVVGDNLTRCSRYHGRPLTAQISVLSGLPVAWCLFGVQPPSTNAFAYYALLMVTLGLTAVWCGYGVNPPILSEIVEPGNRATIMAWESTLACSFSAIFGNSMVGFLAQNVFGYNLENARAEGITRDTKNMEALGSALVSVSFFPWILCFVAYSLLHWTYPRDMRRLQRRQQERQRGQAAEARPDRQGQQGGKAAAAEEAAGAAAGAAAKAGPAGKSGEATRPRVAAAAAEAVAVEVRASL